MGDILNRVRLGNGISWEIGLAEESHRRPFDRSLALRWAFVVPVSVLLGWLFDRWGVPAAWIIAAIVVSAGVALVTHHEVPVNKHVYSLSRGFIGILAALPLTTMSISSLLGYLPIGIAIALITILVGIGGGVLLHRAQPRAVGRETGILSMLPGGASMMPVLADELGADYRYVALTQYLRLLAVSISLPMVVSFMSTPSGGEHLKAADADPHWWMVLIVLLVALVGEPLGKRIHLPVATVMGPLLLTVIISAFLPPDMTMQPIEPFRILAFLSIGWVCGGGLSMQALKSFSKQLPATILYIVLVIGVCAASAVPLVWIMGISYFEAYLATSPGALETVLALSSEGGAGPAVVALQIIRLLLVLGIAGYLPQLISLYDRFRRRRGGNGGSGATEGAD
ncbi:AbrB family transcriptional regulator [Corynebacterium flavescens]|uniref:AbrB family transcriptional regulator n=1 Tax=Corynebacterium flavescens TaxID=28028 RepID=UPI000EEC57FD|nr:MULTISPECIES: AbrB family transcriptional regulator [Corynebacterium]MDN6099737.1 AbrB family transcriptional regulator [Corynebacterium flavescens]MDN6198415.1 AbrB family transcriptional regulator [Corynebacterium flavescens]MDN6225763.1 AbrB family transcriptional regulator [Corynebacterium flavescens]MDN6431002.1 AbrB family transcriptional regulator [Corynebacterium flavescens]MDN6474749.1 AbrB family transcriptional regulator [Corynebacterium flavescens]